jgi:integrase
VLSIAQKSSRVKLLRRRLHMASPFAGPTGIYQLRRKVPEELRPALGREYKRSLNTRDPAEAKRRYAEELEKCEQAFALARAQLKGAQALTERDIQQLAARWFRAELDRLERSGDFSRVLVPGITLSNETPQGGYVEAQELQTVRQAIQDGNEWDWDGIAAANARSALRDHGIPFPRPASTTSDSLIRAFRTQFENLTEIAQKRHEGNWAEQMEVMPHGELSFDKKAASSKGKSLLDLFESYASEKTLNDGNGRDVKKTLGTYRAVVERFIELSGIPQINDLTRAIIGEFRTKLAKMPAKGNGIRGMSAAEMIAEAEAKSLPTLSAATIKNQLRALSAVLGHGVRLGLLTENPVLAGGFSKAAAKAVTRSAATKRKRKEYSKDELRAIFSSPIYTPEGWSAPRANFGKAWYWMPLLLYYTGARREELAQLHVADVKSEAGLHYLSILETEDGEDGIRSVKTDASRRRIPLHPDLIARGFLDYAKAQPKGGQLFPLLTANKTGYFGANFGKRWAAYLVDVVGLETTVTPVHGFRHTFKTLCRGAGIPEDVQDAITGHAGSNKIARDYGSMPMSRMASELAKFPTIAQLLA